MRRIGKARPSPLDKASDTRNALNVRSLSAKTLKLFEIAHESALRVCRHLLIATFVVRVQLIEGSFLQELVGVLQSRRREGGGKRLSIRPRHGVRSGHGRRSGGSRGGRVCRRAEVAGVAELHDVAAGLPWAEQDA